MWEARKLLLQNHRSSYRRRTEETEHHQRCTARNCSHEYTITTVSSKDGNFVTENDRYVQLPWQVRMVRAPPPMTLPRGGATLTLPPGTTLVRAPMASNMRPGVPQQMSVVRPPVPTASTPATPTTLSLPPKPTLQVQVPGAGGSTPVRLPQPPLQVQVPISGASGTGAVRPAKLDGNVSLIKTQHPASLPPTPRYIDDPKKKRLPPKPALKITKAASGEKGLVLSWNMTFNTLYADIQTYQLYAYQETNSPPATSHWKKVGDVRALPLPMACTLTQFIEGHKYHFAVRAVDVHNRLGPFSDPSSILL
ncbi:hypothetical protein HPB49_015345 [Dermacentor silvarum]|uniref:Uncharacterized protein n=1 Tax=Dermacentor silvarum TaxID=543639 RepID=A0ACB8CRT7_DERSI|nr:hypothetical protein HPB49_015345 [Dermacentor silvarum]